MFFQSCRLLSYNVNHPQCLQIGCFDEACNSVRWQRPNQHQCESSYVHAVIIVDVQGKLTILVNMLNAVVTNWKCYMKTPLQQLLIEM